MTNVADEVPRLLPAITNDLVHMWQHTFYTELANIYDAYHPKAKCPNGMMVSPRLLCPPINHIRTVADHEQLWIRNHWEVMCWVAHKISTQNVRDWVTELTNVYALDHMVLIEVRAYSVDAANWSYSGLWVSRDRNKYTNKRALSTLSSLTLRKLL